MNKKQLKAKLDKYGPDISRAFLAAVGDLASNVAVGELEKALAAGDLAGAVRATHVDRAAFAPYAEALDAAFADAAVTAAGDMKGLKTAEGLRAVFRFDVRDTKAETAIRTSSFDKVVEIVDDTVAGLQRAIGQMLQNGDGPATVARLIAGKVNPFNGKREGGIIKLTNSQMQQILNARGQLASLDPAQYKAYLQRKLRNKLFDPAINKAIKNGTPIPAEIQRKAITALTNNTLLNRAKTIARTEALRVLHAGQREAFEQAIDKGLLLPDEVGREWSSSGDGRTRDSHEAMNGQLVAWDEAYTTPSGIRLMYPGDPSAPAEEVINCRCYENIRINYLARIGR